MYIQKKQILEVLSVLSGVAWMKADLKASLQSMIQKRFPDKMIGGIWHKSPEKSLLFHQKNKLYNFDSPG